MRCNIRSVNSKQRSLRALNHPYRWKELNMLLTDRYNAGVLDNRNTDVKTVRQKLFVVFALDKPVGQRGKGSWSGADRNQKQSGRFVLQSEQQRQYFIYISWVLNHAVTRVVCSAPWLSSRLLSLSTCILVSGVSTQRKAERTAIIGEKNPTGNFELVTIHKLIWTIVKKLLLIFIFENLILHLSGFMKMVLKNSTPNLDFTKLLGLLKAM